MDQRTGSKLGKEYVKAVYCHLVYLNYMQSIMRNARLYEASPARWTWVWVNSGSFWWAGKSGVLQPMGLQRVVHNWVTKLNWVAKCKLSYFRKAFLILLHFLESKVNWIGLFQFEVSVIEPCQMVLKIVAAVIHRHCLCGLSSCLNR